MKLLHFKKGSRFLNLSKIEINNKKIISLRCIENWDPEDEFDDGEHNDVAYYLDQNEIDQLIEKLKEAKEFLNQ